MSDNLTWKMAADCLEEKGFDEQATALRVLAGFSHIATDNDPLRMESHLRVSMSKKHEMMADFSGAIVFVEQMLQSLRSRHRPRPESQAEYDIIQRDEARFLANQRRSGE